jgi:hypothetical protein
MNKGTYDVDTVAPSEVIHFRKVYFSMCVEADYLLGRVMDALKR